jgi:hypothetical protein
VAQFRLDRKLLVPLAGAAVVVLAIAGFLLRPQTDTPSAEPPGPVAPPSGFAWTAGATQSYQLLVTTRIRMQLPGAAVPESFVQEISGLLHMKVFEADEASVHLGFQLSPVTYSIGDAPEPGIEAGLSAPFLAVFERDGRPRSFRFPEALERQQWIILEEIVRTFQLVFADADDETDGSSRTWTVSEEHATGRYLAYYQAQRDGSLRKKKTLYTEVRVPLKSSDPSEEPKIHLKKSSIAFLLKPGVSWLSEAKVEEDLVVTVGHERITEALMEAELQLVSTSPDAKVGLFGKGAPQEMLAAFSFEGGAEGEGARLSAAAARKRLAELVTRIGGEPSLEKRLKHRTRLEELLRQHPELAYELIESIEAPGVSKDADATLLHALERAGTPDAQAALVMVMEDVSLTQLNRSRSIVALGGVENATDEAIQALLLTHANSPNSLLANTSLLAVGAIGRDLKTTAPERAGGVRGDLSQSLARANGPEELGIALKAMGNMGDPTLTGDILPYVDDPSPYVRSAAAWALSSVGAEGVVEQLTERLVVEEAGPVRSELVAAIDGLADQQLDALTTVHGMILGEPDPTARYRMARYLGSNLDAYPQGIEPLTELAVSDPSKRIRKYAVDVVTGDRDG